MSRFHIPYLCKFEGTAIWADGSDMLLRADLSLLEEEIRGFKAVYVVKHDYIPASDRKYIGTAMEAPNEAYERKNWSSLIYWNCAHPMNRGMTRSFVESQSGRYLHRFSWLEDEQIGSIPKEWNWLDEFGHKDKAKLVHYTNGIPGFQHYRDAPHAEEWKRALRQSQRGLW
jgi:hypothetical protein